MRNKTVQYKDLVKLFKNNRKEQIFLFIICSLSISADLCLVYQVKGLVDCIVERGSYYNLIGVLKWIIFFGVTSFFLTLYQVKKWHYFRNRLINQMRFTMFQSLLRKPKKFYDENTTGDLSSRVLNDGSLIAESAGIDILMIVLNLFRVLSVMVILMYFHLGLGLIVIGVIPVYLYLLVSVNGKMRTNSQEEREAFGELQQMLIENIKGVQEIKTLGKYDFFTEKFDKALNENYYKKMIKMINQQVHMYAITNLMTIFLPVLVLALGAILVYQNQLSIGTLIAFYTFLNKLIEPIDNLADAYQGSRRALGSADRVYEFIFDVDDALDREAAKANKLEGPLDKIEINIHQYLWGEHLVLDNLKYTINKGDRVFIYGESGKGKSTLLNLIMDYYTLPDGYIKIDGKNVIDISKHSYYESVLMMNQEPFIFRGTIRENLMLGDSFSDEALNRVLDVVCIDKFVKEKGLGYQLIESGGNLSGGQKQRIALARILLRKPKLLLLDEATSALDIETENELIEKLDKYLLENGMTLIAVSHNHNIKQVCNKELCIA